MRFFARIRVGSTVDRAWHKHHRISGVIEGVEFRLTESGFVATEIEPHQVEALMTNESVILEGVSNPPAVILETLVEVMKDPEAPPEVRMQVATTILDRALSDALEPLIQPTPPPRRGRR